MMMSGVSGTYGIIAAVTTAPDAPTQLRRISRRAAAVAPSATLAVDAKAKALQAAGVPVIVSSDETSGFRSTVEELEAAATPRTKALLFVSPSNPTGAVYPREEIEAIGHWAVERGLWGVKEKI